MNTDDVDNMDNWETEMVDIFDEDENLTDTVPKSVAFEKNLLRRGVIVYVQNSSKKLLVHKRADCKKAYPGLWDVAVGGWVISGEDPIDGARREAKEEIGADLEPVFLLKYRYRSELNNDINYVYKTLFEGPVEMDPKEVSEYKWISRDDIIKEVKETGSKKWGPWVRYEIENIWNKVFPEEQES